MNSRGLDSGLAKAAPSAEGLDSKTYRAYRRRLQLFSKQCSRRGQNVAIEGAFLTLSLLQDATWDAAEQISLEEVETAADPFRPITKLLDHLFQFEDDVEIPARCEEFFQDFSRLKNEEMQSYIIRHGTAMKKLKEVNVEIPDLLAGWHMLARAGVPRWTHLQVKSLCGGTLGYAKVSQALLKMFGGDHKPNTKDLYKGGGDNTHIYLIEEDAFYEDDDYDDYLGGNYGCEYDDVFWEDSEDPYYDTEYAYAAEDEETVPEDLEQAADAVDEAFLNYTESRRRMRDIALSRGFFPVVAMPPSDWNSGGGNCKFGGGSKGKSKRKSRGKGKGKGRGKSFGKGGEKGGFRRYAICLQSEAHGRHQKRSGIQRRSAKFRFGKIHQQRCYCESWSKVQALPFAGHRHKACHGGCKHGGGCRDLCHGPR